MVKTLLLKEAAFIFFRKNLHEIFIVAIFADITKFYKTETYDY